MSRLLMTPIEVKNNLKENVRNIQKSPNGDFLWRCLPWRIFGTILMNSLHNSFTAHLGLPFFLSKCILLTGPSLVSACTSPLILALRVDSPDRQLQWRDSGGTVASMCPWHLKPLSPRCHKNKIQQQILRGSTVWFPTLKMDLSFFHSNKKIRR